MEIKAHFLHKCVAIFFLMFLFCLFLYLTMSFINKKKIFLIKEKKCIPQALSVVEFGMNRTNPKHALQNTFLC